MSAKRQEAIAQQQVIKATLARIASHKGVLGYVVVHPKDGRMLDFAGFGGSADQAAKFADHLHQYTSVVQSTVRLLDFDDDLTFLRMRWRNREIIAAPDLNKEYVLFVVQDQQPSAETGAA